MKTLSTLLALALLLAVVGPFALVGWRIADTWTPQRTDQIIGGLMAVCGGSGVMLAGLLGAAIFAKLSAWQPGRPSAPTSTSSSTNVVEGQWRELPPPPTAPVPPWGVTGGGMYDLLPEPRQDERYAYTDEVPSTKRGAR